MDKRLNNLRNWCKKKIKKQNGNSNHCQDDGHETMAYLDAWKVIDKINELMRDGENFKTSENGLDLHIVTQQSELLKAFYIYCSGFYMNAEHFADTRIDNFTKSLL